MTTDREILRLVLMRVNAEDLAAEVEALNYALHGPSQDRAEGLEWAHLHARWVVLREKARILKEKVEDEELDSMRRREERESKFAEALEDLGPPCGKPMSKKWTAVFIFALVLIILFHLKNHGLI